MGAEAPKAPPVPVWVGPNPLIPDEPKAPLVVGCPDAPKVDAPNAGADAVDPKDGAENVLVPKVVLGAGAVPKAGGAVTPNPLDAVPDDPNGGFPKGVLLDAAPNPPLGTVDVDP